MWERLSMSRFILLSVPKSKAQHEGNRPQDKHKFQFGTDSTQDKAIFEQHKEIHRVYFLVEQMIKSHSCTSSSNQFVNNQCDCNAQ